MTTVGTGTTASTQSTVPTLSTPTSTATGVPSTTATTIPSTTASATPVPPTASINFRQLEELVKKWTIELGDQEKEFLDLATKVNYWDKNLIANGEKIWKLNETMEKVKSEHERMENVLDYIKNYQKDFETFLESLEASCPVPNETTPERVAFYGTVEKLNTELQQLSEELKEIIRLANVSNKTTDRTDPVSQIIRILNEHTDTLQWVDEQTVIVKESLEEVSKMHQVFKRDQERSLRLMFKPS